MMPIELLVVDDHNLFRRGLVALLSQDGRFVVSCQAGDLGEALRCLKDHKPDVILLDNHLPGVRGVDGIVALKDALAGVRILMLTVSEDEEDLSAALQAGADGYLLKTVESDKLCESIEKVLTGESVVSPEMMTKLVTAFRSKFQPLQLPIPAQTECIPSGLNLLSAREREVLSLIAKGDSNKLIARHLDIAETTVKIHVQHILRKLQLNSRVQAAVYAAGYDLG
jgi:two-component system, NarL family, nitrate/nitrite response regulator NarL